MKKLSIKGLGQRAWEMSWSLKEHKNNIESILQCFNSFTLGWPKHYILAFLFLLSFPCLNLLSHVFLVVCTNTNVCVSRTYNGYLILSNNSNENNKWSMIFGWHQLITAISPTQQEHTITALTSLREKTITISTIKYMSCASWPMKTSILW